MRVMFIRQLGQTGAGRVREVSAGEGEWLVAHGFGVPVDSVSVAAADPEVEPEEPGAAPAAPRLRRKC